MADVQKPNSDESWPQETVEYLRNTIPVNAACKMIVNKTDPLSVALFQITPSHHICVNSVLVEEDKALSSGEISQTVLWPSMLSNEVDDDDESDLAFQMMKKSQEVLTNDEDGLYTPSGYKIPVTVLKFDGPDLIYVKLSRYQSKQDELHKDLQIHYSSGTMKQKNEWKVGDSCAVLDQTRNNYFRGVVRANLGSGSYLVHLLDHARELTVTKNAIFILNPYFTSSYCNCYVLRCRLSNIKPAGDAGRWSQMALEMLEKIFASYKSFYIEKVESNYEDKIVGVSMWYCLTTPAKALEPSLLKFVSINQSLVESGVAFATSSAVPTVKPEAKKDTKKEAKRPDTRNEQICEDHEVVENQVPNSWPKAARLTKREFEANLTCVDNDGIFTVRDEELQAKYLEIEEEMTSKLNGFARTLGVCRVGDICSIYFSGKWYRGLVLSQVDSDTLNVEMIDFGSVHEACIEDVSPAIMFPEYPPLVYKVSLYDVYTKNNKFTEQDVQGMLEIVADRVKVVVKNFKNPDLPEAEVFLESGLSVNDLILQKCPHMYRLQNTVSLGVLDDVPQSSSSDEDMPETFTFAPLAERMHVVNAINLGKGYSVVLTSDKDYTKTEKFASFSAKIHAEAKARSGLGDPRKDMPCICVHPSTKKWVRGMVCNTDSLQFGYVLVFFVDCGKVEMVSVGKLKEISSDWLQVPVVMRLATLDIELLQSAKSDVVLKELMQLQEKLVRVEVVSESPLKVHLHDEKDFCYQKCISRGFIKPL